MEIGAVFLPAAGLRDAQKKIQIPAKGITEHVFFQFLKLENNEFYKLDERAREMVFILIPREFVGEKREIRCGVTITNYKGSTQK